jgi:tRNA pseudouridine38-40 synthase
MFLRHMNRALVGTMLDVARGVSAVEEFAELLDGRPRALAGRTAPAHGLALAAVGYADGACSAGHESPRAGQAYGSS